MLYDNKECVGAGGMPCCYTLARLCDRCGVVNV